MGRRGGERPGSGRGSDGSSDRCNLPNGGKRLELAMTSPIETSFFAFATDLRDEGIETVLENVAGRAGAGGVTMAAAYHHGRDIFPHNPVGKVRFLDGGAIFFQPDPRRYRDLLLQPHVSRLAAEPDLLSALCR